MTDFLQDISAYEMTDFIRMEIEVCEAIFSATQIFEEAAKSGDIEKMETALAERAVLTRRLEHMGEQTKQLAESAEKNQIPLKEEEALLQSIIAKTLEANANAQQLAGSALSGLRKKIEKINSGQKMLRGYRGHVQEPPRFTDKRR